MPRGILSAVVGILVLIGHLGLLPMIFLYASKFSDPEKIDAALIVGPVLAAYLVSVSLAATAWAERDLTATPKANFFYVTFALVLPMASLLGLYYIIWLMQNTVGFKPELAKQLLGVIEIFIGGSLAVIMKDLFKVE